MNFVVKEQQKINNQAKQIIADNLYMTVAVADKSGSPWIFNAYFVNDRKYNLYWYSSRKTLHSQILQSNPQAAIVIFNSQATGDETDAVYFKAKTSEVKNKKELLKGLSLYARKLYQKKTDISRFVKGISDFKGLSELRLYKAEPLEISKLAPSRIYRNKYLDSRLKVRLP